MAAGEQAQGGDANEPRIETPYGAQIRSADRHVAQPPSAVSSVAILRIDRRGEITESNVPDTQVRRVADAFRSSPWYRDRWTRRELREAALKSLNTDTPGGLVLIAPGMRFDTPPPFHEFFEPVELTQVSFTDNPGLRALSGDAPTREERQGRVLLWILGPFGVIFAGLIIFLTFFAPIAPQGRLALLGTFAFVGVVLLLVTWLLGLRGQWFLIPGGVAIVRSFGKARQRMRIYTRHEAVPVLRYVHTGKSTIRTLSLLTAGSERPSTHVSERQAIAFLAAWQSHHPPPGQAELFEVLVGPEFQRRRRGRSN